LTTTHLIDKANTYIRRLCLEIPNRRVGSIGNQAATDYFARVAASFGFTVDTPSFDCMDWTVESARLTVGDTLYGVFASPYSLGCQVQAPLRVASTVAELEASDVTGSILLLQGEIAKEQLMPKNFPFYNPEHHQQIIHFLEAKKPGAIVAATSRNAAMVGSIYPVPLIEDGDFDIPSVYMTEAEGNRLAGDVGKTASLESRAHRLPSKGCNVIARKGGRTHQRLVLCAHIDAKRGSPGAVDNAGGVIGLLLLAELLADYSGKPGIELVAMNGEDYYSNPGEQQYLALNAGRFSEIVLGINLDGVGYHKGDIAYSLYGCPENLGDQIRAALTDYPGIVAGEAWYQGDHGLFIMNQRPALAFTSSLAAELLSAVIHSPKDSLELIDTAKLANFAHALRDLILNLNRRKAPVAKTPIGRLTETVDQFCRYITALPADALAEREWGPKEVLAHLVYHHELYVGRVQAFLSGTPADLPVGRYKDLNAQAAASSRCIPPAELVDRFRTANQRLSELYQQHDPREIPVQIKAGVRVFTLAELVPAVEGHVRNHLKILRKNI
jgi:aminopeptidase YwaD